MEKVPEDGAIIGERQRIYVYIIPIFCAVLSEEAGIRRLKLEYFKIISPVVFSSLYRPACQGHIP